MPADETWMPPPARATRVVVVADEQSLSDPPLRRDEPDVVLLDLMLPDIDGRELGSRRRPERA